MGRTFIVLGKQIVTAGVLVTLSVLAGLVLLSGSRVVGEQNETWIQTAERQSQSGLTDLLFRSAVGVELISYDPERDELALLTSREYRALRGGSAGGPAEAKSDIELSSEILQRDGDELFEPDVILELMSKSRGPGAEIRTVLQDFERSRAILAVRDAGLTGPCQVLTDTECTQTPWTVHLSLGNSVDGFAAALDSPTGSMRASVPDAATFAALGRGVSAPFGNWSMASGQEIANSTFVVRPVSVVGRPGDPVVIDVIGQNVRAPVDAQLEYFCFDPSSEAGRVQLRSCDETQQSVAARIRMTLSSSPREPITISAKAITVPLLPEEFRQALLREKDEQQELPEPRRVRLSDRLSLLCDVGARRCDPVLATTTRHSRLARDLTLQEAIDEQLVDLADGQTEMPPDDEAPAIELFQTPYLQLVGPNEYELTQLARDLNLVSAIGVPGVSFGSYLGFLENLPSGVEAQDLGLTFDQQQQDFTNQVLRDFLQGGPFPAQQNQLIANQEDTRRAALILVDLQEGSDQGAVRAVAGYPFFSGDSNLWDLQARAQGGNSTDAITATGWRGLDARFQPGSSFKVLSALSLARTAARVTDGVDEQRRSELEAAFLGTSPQRYRDTLDFDILRRAKTIQLTRRPADGTFDLRDRGSVVFPVSEAVSRACGRSAGVVYGVCEALARSSNIWFGLLALRENEKALDTLYGSLTEDLHFTGSAQTLMALGLGSDLPLVRLPAGIDVNETFAPRMEAARMDSAPGLASGMPEARPRGLNDLNVAINAYGQNAFISPLGMATIAGAVGVGRTLSPFIAKTEDAAVPRQAPLLPSDTRSQELLEEIRDGMAAVMRPGGTAYNGFRASGPGADALRTRVFAKTGTAQIGQASGVTAYTHWLVGWLENERGVPRYAFACAVSHVAGGSPCATVTGEWLSRLDSAGLLQ